MMASDVSTSVNESQHSQVQTRFMSAGIASASTSSSQPSSIPSGPPTSGSNLGTSVVPADYEKAWVLSEEQVVYYTRLFTRMQPDLFSFVDAIAARNFFSQSRLDTGSLSLIWDLSDVDGDGVLSLDEFCIAMHLSVGTRHGLQLPTSLPGVLARVAGQVVGIAAIFAKHTSISSASHSPQSASSATSTTHKSEFQSGQPSSISGERGFGFGFDDDFGSHFTMASGDTSDQSAVRSATSHPHAPTYSQSGGGQTSSQRAGHVPRPNVPNPQQPILPPRTTTAQEGTYDSVSVSPSNPPPSHPPPALRGGFKHTVQAAASVNIEVDGRELLSRSNTQLIGELKELVVHRNKLDQQIEQLQNVLIRRRTITTVQNDVSTNGQQAQYSSNRKISQPGSQGMVVDSNPNSSQYLSQNVYMSGASGSDLKPRPPPPVPNISDTVPIVPS